MFHLFSERNSCMVCILTWFEKLRQWERYLLLRRAGSIKLLFGCVCVWFYSTILWHKATLSLKLKTDSVSLLKHLISKYLRAFEMSSFTPATGSKASVIYTTCILFSERSVHITLLSILNLLTSLPKGETDLRRQASKTDLPYSLILIHDPKWPLSAQSPENKILLDPKILKWALLVKQDLCKICLEILPPSCYQSENPKCICFLES